MNPNYFEQLKHNLSGGSSYWDELRKSVGSTPNYFDSLRNAVQNPQYVTEETPIVKSQLEAKEQPKQKISEPITGLGQPGAGLIGKLLPGIEALVQSIEQRSMEPLKKYATIDFPKSIKERAEKMQTPEGMIENVLNFTPIGLTESIGKKTLSQIAKETNPKAITKILESVGMDAKRVKDLLPDLVKANTPELVDSVLKFGKDILYHGTNKKSFEAIAKGGFDLGKVKQFGMFDDIGTGIHFTEDINEAKNFGNKLISVNKKDFESNMLNFDSKEGKKIQKELEKMIDSGEIHDEGTGWALQELITNEGYEGVYSGEKGKRQWVFYDTDLLNKTILEKTTTKQSPKPFQGFKDLTTKFLDYAKGKTTLSRQEIEQFARRPELKKGEADLLMRKLDEFDKPATTFDNTDFKRISVSDALKNADFEGNRNISRSKVDKIKESITKTGEVKPIFTDEVGTVDGLHRLTAMQELGIKEVPVYSFKGDLSQLDSVDRKKIANSYLESKEKVSLSSKLPAQETRKYKSAEVGRFAENDAELLYHGTGEQDAQKILREGFKTGAELGKGEKTTLISLGTKERAMGISRGEKATTQLPVPIKGLKLLEVKAGEIYPNSVEEYTKIMNEGGYDGIRVIDDVYTGSGKTSEVLLKKEVATSQLTDLWNKAKGSSKIPAQEFADSIRRDLISSLKIKIAEEETIIRRAQVFGEKIKAKERLSKLKEELKVIENE